MTSENARTTDGFSIAIERFQPPHGEPTAVAIIASAMGVAQRFYAPFAEWLAAQGVAVYTFDYRGIGRSAPPGGRLKGFSATIRDWAAYDCAAVIDAAARRFPELPLFWIGHSVGAQVFGLVPNRDRVRAVLSVAAGSGYYRLNARPLRYYVLSFWLMIMPLALRLSGYFPGRRLGMVGDLPYGVAEQWRRWCLAADYFGVEPDVRAKLAEVDVPITALSMQDDEMMTLRGTRALFDLYANAEVDVRRMRPSELGVPAIGHFGFFRAKMAESLWPMVPAWIDRMSAGAAAPYTRG